MLLYLFASLIIYGWILPWLVLKIFFISVKYFWGFFWDVVKLLRNSLIFWAMIYAFSDWARALFSLGLISPHWGKTLQSALPNSTWVRNYKELEISSLSCKKRQYSWCCVKVRHTVPSNPFGDPFPSLRWLPHRKELISNLLNTQGAFPQTLRLDLHAALSSSVPCLVNSLPLWFPWTLTAQLREFSGLYLGSPSLHHGLKTLLRQLAQATEGLSSFVSHLLGNCPSFLVSSVFFPPQLFQAGE